MAAVLILIAATFYGVSPILAKTAYGYGVTPLILLTWRSTIAGVMFWGASIALGRPFRINVRLAAVLVALGTTLVPLQVFSYFYALSLLPASTASVVVNTSPVHVAWMERLVLGERLAPADLVILVVIVAGAVLVAGATPQIAGHAAGLTALGTATVASALYLVVQRRLVRDVPPLEALAVIQTCSAAVYWAAAAATGQTGLLPHPAAAVAVAGSAVLSSVASLLVLIALKTLAATRTAMLGMLEPVVTVALSVALLGDRMTWPRLGGIVTVLGGITVFYWRLRQPRRLRPAAPSGSAAPGPSPVADPDVT